MNIFSDSFRWPLVAVAAALLTGILVLNYVQVHRNVRLLCEVFAHPQENAGRPVSFSYARIIALADSLYTVNYRGLILPVHRQGLPPLAVRDVVSFQGTLQADGSIVAGYFHVHSQQKLKLYVSQLPMIIIFILVLMQYRFNFRRWWFEKRGSAHA